MAFRVKLTILEMNGKIVFNARTGDLLKQQRNWLYSELKEVKHRIEMQLFGDLRFLLLHGCNSALKVPVTEQSLVSLIL